MFRDSQNSTPRLDSMDGLEMSFKVLILHIDGKATSDYRPFCCCCHISKVIASTFTYYPDFFKIRPLKLRVGEEINLGYQPKKGVACGVNYLLIIKGSSRQKCLLCSD